MQPGIRSDRRQGRHRSPRAASSGWRPAAFTGPWRETIDFHALLILFIACALGGGSSFAEVPSLLFVRPIALLCLMLFLLSPAPAAWSAYRMPLVLLAAFAGLMAVQLVPLPPAIWTVLPGRAPYLDVARLAGIAQPWRPISLAPDLTLNSLVSLIVPAAVLAGFAKLRDDQRQASVLVLVIVCGVSAAVGIAQFAGGKGSALYLYRRTYEGFPVGLLSNRNHQAALLSLIFPALRVWTLMPAVNRAWSRNRHWLALALGVMVVPVILATGSRAGSALMILAITVAFVLFPPSSRETGDGARVRQLLIRIGLPVLAVVLIALTYLFGRAASIERLVSLSAVDGEQRFQFAPVVLRIIKATFPAGTGFGSFDPVFRQYETDDILISSYFNHAHNEVLEMTVMAGLPGLALLAVFLLWWGGRLRTVVKARADASVRLARLGALAVGGLLLASLVDYPLRAPIVAAVFAMACCWLCEYRTSPRARGTAG